MGLKMKNLFLLIITISILFAGCSKKEEKPITNKNQFATDTSEIKTTPVSNPNESFSFKYIYEKGKKYRYRISSIASDIETMKAETTMTQTFKQNSIYNLELTPSETDAEGTIEINAVINSIKIDALIDGQKLTYESGTIKDTTDKIKYAQYEALANNPFAIRVSKIGEIIEIMRVDKIVNKFFEINVKANSMNQEQKAALRTSFIEGLLRPLFTQIFRQIPDHNVAKDSTWSIAQPPVEAMVFKLDNKNIYKISSLEKFGDDKIAIIDGNLKTVITGNNKAVNRGVSYDFTRPVVSATGKIYFDITKGVIMKSKINTKTNTHFTKEAPSPKGIQKEERWGITENTYVTELL
jgi:hypothetical protein